ncbi:MAG TPA: alpha/beta hydrolase [Mycobacteriales bacterium]|nr:alpha/beta hydrolase [Mycobacteriales bacterium]
MTTATLIDRLADASPGPGPIRWAIGIGLGTGLLGAALLTLVVFAGAGEHAITGSVLLAFGFGWAVLAVLSVRWTGAPQRWALVPAVLMGGAGLALLTLAPGDGALTAAGWVWPPAVLALAAWMVPRVRRVRPGRGLLVPVVAVLAAAAVGGGYATVTATVTAADDPRPGTSYDVGGHRLHLNCAGSGGPTVVLENGLGETSPLWSLVTATVGQDTRVCAYDRAGQGWSGDAPRPQDGAQVAADLHTLLVRAHETGPYVLVGHSTGGVYALTYMARYPAEVAGMVLLDSAGPNQFTALPDYPGQYAMMRRLTALLPSIARLGLTRLMPASDGLPARAAQQARDFASSPRGLRSMRDELSVYPTVFAQAGALTGLAGRPLVVVTAAETQRDTRGWSAAQDRLAALSTTSSHRLADTTHAGLLDDPRGAGVSARAITDVVRSVRTGAPLPAR